MLRNTGRRAGAERALHMGVMAEPPPSISRWRIADLLLDTRRQRVWRGEDEIPLPKLTYALFVALVRRCPDVVSDEDLMKVVWPGVIVSPETVSQRVKLLRQALKDNPRSPRYVGRLRSRGYHLVPTAVPVSDEEHGVIESRLVDGSTVPAAVTANALEATSELEAANDLEASSELVAVTELFPPDAVTATSSARSSLIARLRALITHIRGR